MGELTALQYVVNQLQRMGYRTTVPNLSKKDIETRQSVELTDDSILIKVNMVRDPDSQTQIIEMCIVSWPQNDTIADAVREIWNEFVSGSPLPDKASTTVVLSTSDSFLWPPINCDMLLSRMNVGFR